MNAKSVKVCPVTNAYVKNNTFKTVADALYETKAKTTANINCKIRVILCILKNISAKKCTFIFNIIIEKVKTSPKVIHKKLPFIFLSMILSKSSFPIS